MGVVCNKSSLEFCVGVEDFTNEDLVGVVCNRSALEVVKEDKFGDLVGVTRNTFATIDLVGVAGSTSVLKLDLASVACNWSFLG